MANRLILLAAFLVSACATERPVQLADEMETVLRDQMLAVWYPRVLDAEEGGYFSDFDAAWALEAGPQHKMIVTQARHVWTLSKASERYEEPDYLAWAGHGVAFLRDAMWDADYGGFYTLVTRSGALAGNGAMALKTAYGNAFAIYGLAAYVAASGDTSAMRMAQEAFMWLETHSHDPVHGGYFQHITREGDALEEGFGMTPAKDQNSSIHLLEAFTELYHVWPDPLVRARLAEMLYLIRDTMVLDESYLGLYFDAEWRHFSLRDSSEAYRHQHQHFDYVSYGHDVETAFLMLEAAEALELPIDTTLRIGKQMVDHAIQYGWDAEVGGIIDEAYYYAGADAPTILKPTKTWWAQAEALNAWRLFDERFPDDPMQYGRLYEQQWAYIDQYILDHENGGWYGAGLDQQPEYRTMHKAHIWKSPYHTARALMQSAE